MAQINRSISLIGPMGSSKSATARNLARITGMRLFDVDKEFEKRYGKIDEFFANFGESEFRAKETELLEELAQQKRSIIATGGGAVLSRRGMAALRRYTDVVYLTADIDVLKQRIARSSRPLKNDLERILKERAPLYKKYADYRIDTSYCDQAETAENVMNCVSGVRPPRYFYVLCDADDTLLDFQSAQTEAVSEVLKEIDAYSEEAVALYREINAKFWEDLSDGKITREELKVARFAELFNQINSSADPAVAAVKYEARLNEIDKYIDGAVTLLSGLKVRGVRTYVITNGFGRRSELERVKHLLSGIFPSKEIGYEKPSLEYFKEVYNRIGQPNPDKILVLGDGEKTDIFGARRFGVDSCLFDATGAKTTEADYKIKMLAELLDIV